MYSFSNIWEERLGAALAFVAEHRYIAPLEMGGGPSASAPQA
jgi:hypothetical protein